MRFFSNDAKDSADEQGSDEHRERVQSDPIAVPQQRAGSPWSDPRSPADSGLDDSRPDDPRRADSDSDPDNSDAELADQERTDGTVDSGTTVNGYDATTSDPSPSDTDSPGYGSTEPVRDESEVRHDGDALVPSDESSSAPASDSLGAHRVEEDEDRSDDDGPGDNADSPDDNADDVTSTDVDDEQDSDRLAVQNAGDDRDDVVDVPLEEPETTDEPQAYDAQDHDTRVQDETIDTATDAEPADETPVATTTTYGPDGTVTTTAGDDDSDPDSGTAAADADLASADADAEAEVDATAESAGDDGDPAVKDDGGFDDPTAVDPTTEEPLDSTSAADEPVSEPAESSATDADAAPDVVPVPVPVGAAAGADDGRAEAGGDKLPGSVTAPELGSLFAEADAQSFHDRWREVQLRFVDSPKEATAEAARLVDEAVDKLTASLKAQKDQVSNDGSEDTEQLRVELRGYRDILNRVLTL